MGCINENISDWSLADLVNTDIFPVLLSPNEKLIYLMGGQMW